MTLIKLTELAKDEGGEIKERDVLLNPEGIGTAAASEIILTSTPLIGVDSAPTYCTQITLRNNQRLLVKDSLEHIASLVA